MTDTDHGPLDGLDHAIALAASETTQAARIARSLAGHEQDYARAIMLEQTADAIFLHAAGLRSCAAAIAQLRNPRN